MSLIEYSNSISRNTTVDGNGEGMHLYVRKCYIIIEIHYIIHTFGLHVKDMWEMRIKPQIAKILIFYST
jgi:hypothetical protein